MPRLLSKSLLLTVLLVLLASCVQYRSLSEGAGFDAGKGTAIVVMGVALGEITLEAGSPSMPLRVGSMPIPRWSISVGVTRAVSLA